jgi:para-nitrobenzyl esterase
MQGVDRRRVLALGAATVALGGGGQAAAGWYLPGKAAVRTSNGPVSGATEGGVHVFKGVRYGAPPTGALRFKAPVKPAAWTTPAAATAFGPPAMQMTDPARLGEPTSELARSMEAFAPYKQEAAIDSEDCLFLNVWTPATQGSAAGDGLAPRRGVRQRLGGLARLRRDQPRRPRARWWSSPSTTA